MRARYRADLAGRASAPRLEQQLIDDLPALVDAGLIALVELGGGMRYPLVDPDHIDDPAAA